MTDGDAAGAGTGAVDRPDAAAAETESGADAGSTEPSGADAEGATGTGVRGRDVVVPMPLYKVVTVFSTLIAVVSVVFGFMLLDAATLNVSFLGNAIRGLLAFVGLAVADGILSTVLAALGLGIIGFGAGVYVLGTRFRARGMGKSQEDSGEASNNDG
ncbi:DUF7315 family membrane protein [Halobellus rubicundus]|uniref:DUF7315 family membrane protein n=1 Tax=Halobellus rubicundus TaxID=2996466 RepID=UPI003FD6D2E7